MNNFHKKYKKYKNKYLVYKKQIGGKTIEIIDIYVSEASRTIANVTTYLSDGVVIPEGIPPTLINYAKSKAFQKILGFSRSSLESLDSSKKELLELKSPEVVAEEEKKKGLLAQIEEEKAKAHTLVGLIEARIAELPYNKDDTILALREHQLKLGSPPNWNVFKPYKDSYLSAKNFEEAEPIRLSMREKCVELEKQEATWKAEGYFQKVLENEAFIEFNYRL